MRLEYILSECLVDFSMPQNISKVFREGNNKKFGENMFYLITKGACRKMRNISSLLLKFQVNQETQDSNIQKVEENSEFCVEHCLSKKNQYKSVLSTRDDGTFVTHGSNSSPRRTANGKFHRISTMELKDRLDFSNMQQTIVGKKLTELKEKLGQEKAKHNEELKQLRKEVHKLKAQKDEANRIVTHLESELSKLKESQLHSEQGYKELLNFVTYHIDLMVGMFALKSAETFEALSLCPQVQEPKYQLLEIKSKMMWIVEEARILNLEELQRKKRKDQQTNDK